MAASEAKGRGAGAPCGGVPLPLSDASEVVVGNGVAGELSSVSLKFSIIWLPLCARAHAGTSAHDERRMIAVWWVLAAVAAASDLSPRAR